MACTCFRQLALRSGHCLQLCAVHIQARGTQILCLNIWQLSSTACYYLWRWRGLHVTSAALLAKAALAVKSEAALPEVSIHLGFCAFHTPALAMLQRDMLHPVCRLQDQLHIESKLQADIKGYPGKMMENIPNFGNTAHPHPPPTWVSICRNFHHAIEL